MKTHDSQNQVENQETGWNLIIQIEAIVTETMGRNLEQWLR